MSFFEANFDGLVGPTHNYAGLSHGNVASMAHANLSSNPKAAAKQGLSKMKSLHALGLVQGVIAPQERPDISTLKKLGFTGTDAHIIQRAAKHAPAFLKAVNSASSMWAANAATVSPSVDTKDGKVHFTPANLINKFHRSIEAKTTADILKAMFPSHAHFVHHAPLPKHDFFGDEGAANHTRLCSDYGNQGLELFVFGRYALNNQQVKPTHFTARQTFEASEAIARLHQLSENNVIYIQQNPDVIDKGVFHNDVIAVGNKNVMLYHEYAFLNSKQKIAEIKQKFDNKSPLHLIEVKNSDISVEDAIRSYLFNTQLICLPQGDMAIIAPKECQDTPHVDSYLQMLTTQGTPIKHIFYYDVKQSMQNGGGPACLRLRVTLNDNELKAVNPHVLLDDILYNKLNTWVDKHYRDRLTEADLADPLLLNESRTALDELTQILKLGSVYQFQKI